MRRLVLIILLLSVFSFLHAQDQPDGPTDPDSPSVSDGSMGENDLYLQFQRQDGALGEGVLPDMSGMYISDLVWEGSEDEPGSILIDEVKSIRIKGYTMVKKSRGNLGIVFYFPHLFDIVLKDNTQITSARGRIKELESFTLYSSEGQGKIYSYFIRYWLEDKGRFNDNGSADYNETPFVPAEAAIFLRFSSPR
jgi:hypothetical protein